MQVKREVLRLVSLTIAALAMAGCASPALPGALAATQPMETVTLAATATVTNTPTMLPTKTEAPSLTPTPEGVDYSQAFFDPQSEADFPRVIESPSPIDDPAGFYRLAGRVSSSGE